MHLEGLVEMLEPGPQHVAQAVVLLDPLTSASQVLGLQVCITLPGLISWELRAAGKRKQKQKQNSVLWETHMKASPRLKCEVNSEWMGAGTTPLTVSQLQHSGVSLQTKH